MRVVVAIGSLLLSAAACTAHGSNSQANAPTTASSDIDIPPLWSGYGSAEMQAAIRSCLERERLEGDVANCVGVQSSDDSSSPSHLPRFLSIRQASWVVIDNWELVMRDSLAWLQNHGPRDMVDASQEKWKAAMLADVGLYMDLFEGGSMSIQMATLGAGIRAEATINRVLFLENFRALLEQDE